MLSAIYVILINIVTDMVPYFSILELKFIEIFSVSSPLGKKQRHNLSSPDSNEISSISRSPLVSGTPRLPHDDNALISGSNYIKPVVCLQNVTSNNDSSGDSNVAPSFGGGVAEQKAQGRESAQFAR